jgi:hypothetical protein
MKVAGIVGEEDQRLFLLPVLLALICSVNTLNYSFVSDDRLLIVNAVPILEGLEYQ